MMAVAGISLPNRPQLVYAELTTACNADCPGCDFRRSVRTRRRRFMHPDHLDMLVDQVLALDLDVYLQSGEALLHPKLHRFIESMYRRGGRRRVHLTTNGQLARKRPVPWRLLGSLTLSIDGRDPISSRVRRLGNQEEIALELVTGLLAARTDALSPSIGVSSVIRPENQNRLVDYCRFWGDVGVDSIMLIHLQGTTPAAAAATCAAHPGLSARPRHLREEHWAGIEPWHLNGELMRVRELDNPRISIHPDLHDEDLVAFYGSSMTFVGPPRRCNTPWESIEVAADGAIHLSGICVDLDLGHLEAGGLIEAWKHPALTHFRSILAREGQTPACARCCGYFGGAPL